MGIRFQKRIRIFKGLTLNLSKTGTSWTLGRPGASVNIRGKKVTGTVGVPGSGLSYRETLSTGSTGNPGPTRSGWLVRVVFWLAAIALVAFLFGR